MAEVAYYFNARGDLVWTDPDNIVDNNLETFGYTSTNGAAQVLTGNTCPGTDLGTITKVELRLYGKGDGDDHIDITPIFSAGDGETHRTTPVVSPGDWTPYVDITYDTNHPDWSLWSHIQTLDCKIAFAKQAKANTVHCAKVEIRVTYTPEPTVTTQAVTDITPTTATGHGTIVSVGVENCSKRGICWNTTGNPTVADDKSEETDSFSAGAFSRPMTGLDPSTHYYVKAYAYNSAGYGYGNEVEFDTPWEPPVSDIDVGADPIKTTYGWAYDNTFVDKNNPANASGILHTVQIYVQGDMTGLRVGTFYTTNGTTLKCRDSVLIGDVEAGAVRTFTDLSISVQEGDYIGCYFPAGYIYHRLSGFVGAWTISGEYIDPNDEAEYSFHDGDAISLYGYGDIEAPPVGQPYISRVQRIAGMKTIGVNL